MVPRVTGLSIYPIKSLGGISLSESILETRGLQFDRRWMLVDDEGRFLTQREHAALALFATDIEERGICITARDGEKLRIPFTADGPRVPVHIWQSDLEADVVSETANAWFSDYLGQRCRLVRFPEDQRRTILPEYSREGDHVSFADGFSVTVVCTESLEDLNARMESPVPMNRFRPNIVISGADAFAEDEWPEIEIGEASLRSARKCGRCLVTTTDQATGVRGIEPLRTLATYRRDGQNVTFSQNFIPVRLGRISVGDPVVIV